jgi:hypothetical protein
MAAGARCMSVGLEILVREVSSVRERVMPFVDIVRSFKLRGQFIMVATPRDLFSLPSSLG